MSINTHSLFYFGHTVDEENYAIDFDEGGVELQASLDVGAYTLTEYAAEVERALNVAGALTYTVTVTRATQQLTVAATGNFSLLASSGSRAGLSAFELMGFTLTDKTGAATYTGSVASGSSYETQFKLQNYVSSAHFQKARNATVLQSASGDATEIFKYGDDAFFKFNFKWITDTQMADYTPIRWRPTGVADLVTFMDYLITKAPIEFMPDEDDTATYYKLVLESTPEEKTGVGFQLKEYFDKGLPGFFETGILTLRDLT
jgi:hypothetical protein